MIKTIYITKYALTRGIIKSKNDFGVIENDEQFGKSCYGRLSGYMSQGFYGNDFQMTEELALADAERRRVRKIESLKKQIAKLEKLVITIK